MLLSELGILEQPHQPIPNKDDMLDWLATLAEDWADASNFDIDEHPTFTTENSKELGTYDNHSIWGTSFYIGKITFGILKDGVLLAYLVFDKKPIHINGKDYNKSVKAWTHPDYRRNGLHASIHAFLIDKMHINIISDEKFSEKGLELLKAVIANHKFNVEFYSFKTKKIVKEPPENLYHLPNEWWILFNSDLVERQLFADGRKWGYGRLISEMTVFNDGSWD